MPLNFSSAGYLRYQDDGDPQNTLRHPENYYLTEEATRKLQDLGRDYFALTGDYIWVNDGSLPWGGLFDIAGNWAPPHDEHRCGRAVDAAISSRIDFNQVRTGLGIDFYRGKSYAPTRYHLQLLGKSRKELYLIKNNPGSFVPCGQLP